jgi:hypothetical protein
MLHVRQEAFRGTSPAGTLILHSKLQHNKESISVIYDTPNPLGQVLYDPFSAPLGAPCILNLAFPTQMWKLNPSTFSSLKGLKSCHSFGSHQR